MYVPGPTLQRDGVPRRSDALRDLGDGSRSRADRHPSHTSSGHAAYCTTSAIVVAPYNTQAYSRCVAGDCRRACPTSFMCTRRRPRLGQCGDSTPAQALTVAYRARFAGAPIAGNLRFPLQPSTSPKAAHQMHACGPTSVCQNGRKPRCCYASGWGTAGVVFSPNATALIGAAPFSEGARRTVRALRRYGARRTG